MKHIAATVLAAAACASANTLPSVISPPAHHSAHPAPSAHSAHPAPHAHGNHTVWVTEVLPNITTYIPGPTVFVYGTVTHNVDRPTTLTITDCPCTVVKPITYAPAPSSSACPPNAATTSPCTNANSTVPATPNPAPNSSQVPPPPQASSGTTVPHDKPTNAPYPSPSSPGAPTSGVAPPTTRGPGPVPTVIPPPPPPATAGAGKVAAVSGAFLAGIVGLVAFVL